MTAEPASVGVELPVGAIEEFFSARAKAVDTGDADLRAGLRYLAELGLLAHPELQVSCDVVTAVARCCLASAFSVCAHTMVAEYLSMSASPRLQSQVPRLRDAAVIGCTAMAPAMQNLVGLADLGVRFTRNDDVLVVDGSGAMSFVATHAPTSPGCGTSSSPSACTRWHRGPSDRPPASDSWRRSPGCGCGSGSPPGLPCSA